jgi:phosphoglucomutase
LKEGNKAFVFEYTDPVDQSVSKNQGWIFSFLDGSRIIFRVSGTSSSGATIRIYFEKHVNPEDNLEADVLDTIKSSDNDLVTLALFISKINEVSGRAGPTVIT